MILPRFAEQILHATLAGEPLSRDMAGRAMVYLQARTHYGIVDRAVLGALDVIWRRTLGADDLRVLDELFARLVWIEDGDLEALDRAARTYRDIIGPPDPPPAGEGAADQSGPGGSEGPSGKGADGQEQRVGSLADAVEHAIEHARAEQLQQLDEDLDLKSLVAAAGDRDRPARGGGYGTGRPSGRMPDRGVDRPPFADEIQQARRYATRLRQAITQGTRRIDKRTPGGRFDGRAYTRGQAQRATGRPVSAHPWQVTRQVRAPIEAPHVGLIIDTSGSMRAYEYALGPIAWILTDGLRQIDGRCATALFGNGAELLADGTVPMPLVPGITTGGGTAFAGDAIELVCEHLEMTNPRRPRFVYVLSDGGWADTRAGVQRIRWLAEHAVPTIHLSIGIAPLSVECDRITVITDPADALDQIAADTLSALRARPRTR